MRQIVLDTETTGLEVEQGHRVIEIGCVEILNRRPTGRTFHQYLNPEREIDEGAQEVHGLDAAFLADKPVFADVAEAFLGFVDGAQLIIHNAPFDVGFLDAELKRLAGGYAALADVCSILDTLIVARELHPGQRNSLDALCKRYEIDNSSRTLHGALLDAQILAEVYLAMTGGQTSLSLAADDASGERQAEDIRRVARDGRQFVVRRASDAERTAHLAKLEEIEGKSENGCLWTQFSEFARHD